jgi:cell division protein FtsL
MTLAVLTLLVVASAIACVFVRHDARKLFVDLQRLEAERDQLEIEWGQLRLEQSAHSSHARVEELARERMAMREPVTDEIYVVQP